MKEAKQIEDMLVVKLQVNTEELKNKEATIEKLLAEREQLEQKVLKISETVDVKQANELNLQQEVEYFKKMFDKLSKDKDEEKVSLLTKYFFRNQC